MTQYRVSLIYTADGMRRPLSHRTITRADNGSQAIDIATNTLSTAYESGFKVLQWSVERLEMRAEIAKSVAALRPVKNRPPSTGSARIGVINIPDSGDCEG